MLVVKEENKRNLFLAISKLTDTRIAMGEERKDKGSKRTASGFEKKYINREIHDLLLPAAQKVGRKLNQDFELLLFQVTGVESSTLRTYKTSLNNFLKYTAENRGSFNLPRTKPGEDTIPAFYTIMCHILENYPREFQRIIDRFVIWGCTRFATNTVLNLTSGVIYYGDLLTGYGTTPRPNPKILERAKKLSKSGKGGAVPFPGKEIPLAFFEWLLLHDSYKYKFAGCFYAMMFYGNLRPSITYTLSPKNFIFIDKSGNKQQRPNSKTKQVILEVFRFKNQRNHTKSKRIPFTWNPNQTGPSPTNVIQVFRHLFKTHKRSPKFPTSAKRLRKLLKQFQAHTKTPFQTEIYSPESFRETMMGVSSTKLQPYQMMFITCHRSDRSIKHTYLRKQQQYAFRTYNNLLDTFFQ